MKRTKVAIKIPREGLISAERFFEEATVMMDIRHEQLVALYFVSSIQEPIYIIQEFMSNGCLVEYLRDKQDFIDFEDLIFMAKQVASGMKYLNTKEIIHRDLMAKNVLIGENNIVKICSEIASSVSNQFEE